MPRISLSVCLIFCLVAASANSSNDVTSIDVTRGYSEYGLTSEDLEKYEEIMDSPIGNFYRRGDANIFYVLGAEAKTHSSKMRYARLWAKIELEYYTKLSDSLKYYQRASVELSGENPRIFDIYPPNNTKGDSSSPNFQSVIKPRVSVFLAAKNCTDCLQAASREIKKIHNGSVSGVDLYFTNSNNDDINAWARSAKLPPGLVKSRLVTLNHTAKADADKAVPSIELKFPD